MTYKNLFTEFDNINITNNQQATWEYNSNNYDNNHTKIQNTLESINRYPFSDVTNKLHTI